MTNKLQEWVRALLSRNGVDRPDRRMLYRYRVTDEEFSVLTQSLRDYSNGKSLSDCAVQNLYFPATFVLFGAEWWKRRYDGGLWNWSAMIREFGGQPDSWSPNLRSDTVVAGLGYWGHAIHPAGKTYLGSVIIQGGIPQKLLSKDLGSITALLRGAVRLAARLDANLPEILEIVAEQKDRLPQSLRRDELLGVLAQTADVVIELKRQFNLTGDAAACVEKLDQNEPAWRDRFPLPLGEQAAEALIKILFADVTVPTGSPQFSVDRCLRSTGEGLELTSRVRLPTSLSGENLSQLLSLPNGEDLPRYFAIEMDMGAREVVAEGRRVLGANPETYALSTPRKVWRGQQAAAEHLLSAHLAGVGDVSLTLAGGAELDSELPWVFAEEGEMAQMVGIGSQRVRNEIAWVCYPADWLCRGDDCSLIEVLPDLTVGDEVRLVRRVAGKLTLESPGAERYRVVTGQAGVEPTQYAWAGSRLEYAARPRQVFIGAPRLYRFSADGERFEETRNVEWRRAGSKDRLIPGDLLGPIDAVLIHDGEVVFRNRIVVLGRNSGLVFRSGQNHTEGGITFRGDWGAAAIKVETPGVRDELSHDNHGWAMRLTALNVAPEVVRVLMHWRGCLSPLELALPFPVTGGRFFSASGEELDNGQSVALRELLGARLRVLDSNPNNPHTYALCLKLIKGRQELLVSEPYPVSLSRNAAEVRLFDVQPEIESMLGLTDDLDAHVEIGLIVGNGQQQSIRVRRYDCVLQPDGNGVALAPLDADRVSQEMRSGIQVLATRFGGLHSNPVRFVPLCADAQHTGRWFPDQLQTEPGALFVYPSPDSCLTFRPLVIAGPHLDEDAVPLPAGIRGAVRHADPAERRKEIHLALNAMAGDFRHPDWEWVAEMWSRLGHLPLSSLDFWRCLVLNPAALIAFTLRPWEQAPADLPTIGRRLVREVGLVWESVPISAWRSGLLALRSYWQSVLGAESYQQLLTIDLDNKRRQFHELCPALSLLLDILIWEVHGQKSERHEELYCKKKDAQIGGDRLARSIYDRLWTGGNSHIQQVLFAQNLDAQWPAGLSDGVIKALSRQIDPNAFLGAAKKMLWITDDHKGSVANIPVLLAYAVSTERLGDWWLEPRNRLSLKRHIDFNPEWFELAFDSGIQMAYALGLLNLKRADPVRRT